MRISRKKFRTFLVIFVSRPRTNGARNPNGTKIALARDKIPLRVGGRELMLTLKRNESDSTHH